MLIYIWLSLFTWNLFFLFNLKSWNMNLVFFSGNLFMLTEFSVMRIHPVTHLEICSGEVRSWGRHLAMGKWRRHGLCLQQNCLLGDREKKCTSNSSMWQTMVTGKEGSLDRMELSDRPSLFALSLHQLFRRLPGPRSFPRHRVQTCFSFPCSALPLSFT